MKKLFKVTEIEKEELIKLIERKNSLIELREIAEGDELKVKLKIDMGQVQDNIDKWWIDTKQRYILNDSDNICYYLNFDDGFLYNN